MGDAQNLCPFQKSFKNVVSSPLNGKALKISPQFENFPLHVQYSHNNVPYQYCVTPRSNHLIIFSQSEFVLNNLKPATMIHLRTPVILSQQLVSNNLQEHTASQTLFPARIETLHRLVTDSESNHGDESADSNDDSQRDESSDNRVGSQLDAGRDGQGSTGKFFKLCSTRSVLPSRYLYDCD
jgi:hypothetical protein